MSSVHNPNCRTQLCFSINILNFSGCHKIHYLIFFQQLSLFLMTLKNCFLFSLLHYHMQRYSVTLHDFAAVNHASGYCARPAAELWECQNNIIKVRNITVLCGATPHTTTSIIHKQAKNTFQRPTDINTSVISLSLLFSPSPSLPVVAAVYTSPCSAVPASLLMVKAFLSMRLTSYSEAVGGRLWLVYQPCSKCLKVEVQISKCRSKDLPRKDVLCMELLAGRSG